MLNKINLTFDVFKNMGLMYVFFRIKHMILIKFRWYYIKFPSNPNFLNSVSLNFWKKNLPKFIIEGKNIPLKAKKNVKLENKFKEITSGNFTFFNGLKINIGKKYDWITNPITKYRYNINNHWSLIQDIDKNAGDIKFVWEKARFIYLHDVIRYDFHSKIDQSKFVFDEINDFIDKNPINMGPNYICSQEISLRIFNWTYILHYYKDSKYLTDKLFRKIINSIYWQFHHIYKNINFSRIAVRNNHAITETLLLYLSNKFFPFFPESKKWSKNGKKWFEQEIKYQIYDDGTYLQFSMNYHRVVIQLLTLAIRFSEIYSDPFNKTVYIKAKSSLNFLDNCVDSYSGMLPNYGSNDGSLILKFTDNHYRNYRSQLDDLRHVVYGKRYYKSESSAWYGLRNEKIESVPKLNNINSFKNGGYYIINDNKTKTFVRCGAYKDRPFQADNNHLDLWYNGINYLRDSGSYKYNTNKKLLNYFVGTKGHNTVIIKGRNQMKKGNRFIWYYWIKNSKGKIFENNNSYQITSSFHGFKTIGKNIWHQRKVKKIKNKLVWFIEDDFINADGYLKEIFFHINPKIKNRIKLEIQDLNGKYLKSKFKQGWYSSIYGEKKESILLSCKSYNGFNTLIKIKT